MATTVAIGVGGLGLAAAGLAAVGLAGAAGLGIAAASRLLGRRRQGREVKIPKALESESLQRVLELIRSQDVTGCGMKLVCELAGLRQEELSEEQKAILSLVDDANAQRSTPGEGVLPPGAADYLSAKMVGQAHGDCSAPYPMCSFNGTQLMTVVSSYLP